MSDSPPERVWETRARSSPRSDSNRTIFWAFPGRSTTAPPFVGAPDGGVPVTILNSRVDTGTEPLVVCSAGGRGETRLERSPMDTIQRRERETHMDRNVALAILSALADGCNPETGEVFPREHV